MTYSGGIRDKTKPFCVREKFLGRVLLQRWVYLISVYYFLFWQMILAVHESIAIYVYIVILIVIDVDIDIDVDIIIDIDIIVVQ